MFCGDLNLIACYIHPSPLSSLHSPETYLPAFCIISISKANKESGRLRMLEGFCSMLYLFIGNRPYIGQSALGHIREIGTKTWYSYLRLFTIKHTFKIFFMT